MGRRFGLGRSSTPQGWRPLSNESAAQRSPVLEGLVHVAASRRGRAQTRDHLVFSPTVDRDGLRDLVGEAFDQAWQQDLDDVGDQLVGGCSVSTMGRNVLITISDRRADVRSIVELLCRELETRSVVGALDATHTCPGRCLRCRVRCG